MKREGQVFIFIVVLVLIVVLLSQTEILQQMTGFATSDTVDINITVTGNNFPNVTAVYNNTMTNVSTGPNEATSATYLDLNFTAYDADGFGNLDDSSASVSFTKSGETTRSNTSCQHVADYNTYYANYTCNVTMWWWDGAGTWTINVSISDTDGNDNWNDSQIFYLGTTDGMTMSPTTLTWSSITAGATNQESNENITVNNTGNVDKWIEINATNLRGETNPALAIWAGNFTVNGTAGCEGTSMSAAAFVNLSTAILPANNISLNYKNSTSGQEELCFCIEEAGSELTAQSYSTANESDWTIKITTQ